jgi:DNA (cytosine-5)-methyltransferase 1
VPAYYNEIDPYAAQWLRNLIAAGHIAVGDVDERSIVEVRPDDVRGYTQCHWFAGIGGWSIALRLAGWDDARPVWTGSCPCQPFSAAGAGKAADDSRHLWPAWFPLIAECRPATVFGEQVEAAIGWGWLDAVFADLEGEGYACGAAVLPACGVGAPHIRQRLWFVADAAEPRRQAAGKHRSGASSQASRSSEHGRTRLLAHPNGRHPSPEGLQRGGEHGLGEEDGRSGGLVNPASEQARLPGRARKPGSTAGELGDAPRDEQRRPRLSETSGGRPSALGGSSPWSNCDWLPCTDGKARPVEPGSFPLAHGVQRRASKLRAYGNAIVPQVAAEFIKTSMT